MSIQDFSLNFEKYTTFNSSTWFPQLQDFSMPSLPNLNSCWGNFNNIASQFNFQLPNWTFDTTNTWNSFSTPFTFNSIGLNTTPSWGSFSSPVMDTFESSTSKTKTFKKTSVTLSDYAKMNKLDAERNAQKDPNLEKLKGGNNWSISYASFRNDIPYAGSGVNNFLDHLTFKIGERLVVTSALGSATSPHAKNGGHYDSLNPKLDFGGGLTSTEAYRLKTKLVNTGYFARVEVESDGATCHLDVKIKDNVLAEFV